MLSNIESAAADISRYIGSVDSQACNSDDRARAAAAPGSEIVGEALNRLGQTSSELARSIAPWCKIVDFRDLLIHGCAVVGALPVALHRNRSSGRGRKLVPNTPFDPVDTADATLATDNFRAGEMIGRWARGRLGDAAPGARIVTLDGSGAQVTVEVLRNQGFLRGFGIDIGNPGTMYDENDVRIVGHGATRGSGKGGRDAMEKLIRKVPAINVVYAINEPAAAGAHAALEASGMGSGVLMVSVDGGCQGVRMVASGALGATAMQYPARMASLGVKAVVEFAMTGKMPAKTPGSDFYDTGVTLVTDQPVPGIPSISAERALTKCWG